MLGVGAAAAKKRRLGDRRERTADGGPRWAPACCHAAHGAAAMLHISAAQLHGAKPPPYLIFGHYSIRTAWV